MRQLTVIGCPVLGVAFTAIDAQEPEWTPSSIRDCDRACLVEIIDGYMNAIFTRDPKAVPPLAKAYRMTENTAQVEVGEGVLWPGRSRSSSTTARGAARRPMRRRE